MLIELITAILTVFGKLALDYIQRQQATKANVQTGRDQKSAEINKEAADAERRSATAAAAAPDVDGTIRDMEAGRF